MLKVIFFSSGGRSGEEHGCDDVLAGQQGRLPDVRILKTVAGSRFIKNIEDFFSIQTKFIQNYKKTIFTVLPKTKFFNYSSTPFRCSFFFQSCQTNKTFDVEVFASSVGVGTGFKVWLRSEVGLALVKSYSRYILIFQKHFSSRLLPYLIVRLATIIGED